MTLESAELTRIILLAAIAFCAAFLWTPACIRVLQALKMGKEIRTASETPVFSGMHEKKRGTPTMGGVVIWVTALLLALGFSLLAFFFPHSGMASLDFFSRGETYLPLGALVASALVGLLDDYFNVKRIGAHGGGLRKRYRLFIYTAIAVVGAWWFVAKLDWDMLHVPFVGDLFVGPWFALVCLVVIISTAFSVNETDGLDGLAAGTLLTSFGAFAVIAFAQGKYDLAAFCAVLIGSMLAFLWFNIHPARFFMGDTGAMSLGVTLGVVALLTNAALLLPVIGLVFVLESCSVLLQIFWRKVFKKKLFLSAPFHHHLEAKGWPEPQIVMRLWMISGVAAGLGIALALLDALI